MPDGGAELGRVDGPQIPPRAEVQSEDGAPLTAPLGPGGPGGSGRAGPQAKDHRSRTLEDRGSGQADPPGRLEVQPSNEMWAADESGPSEWTLDTLAAAAQELGIEVSRSQVCRILLAEGVRWRRTRSWTRSKDPDFEGKGRGSSSSTPARPPARRWSAPTNSAR